MNPFNKRLYRGDSTAFVELYDQIGERVFQFVFARIGSQQDAADIAQEVFVRVVKSHRTLAKADNLASYVFMIARNETIRWLNKNKRNQQSLETKQDDEATCGSIENVVDSNDWVNTLLGRLEEVDREIVQLKVFSELTFKEIANIVQLPESNVTSRYRRAIGKLESRLAQTQIDADLSGQTTKKQQA